MPKHKENDTLKKLAAALFSETTVALSPSTLVKYFRFAKTAEENIH